MDLVHVICVGIDDGSYDAVGYINGIFDKIKIEDLDKVIKWAGEKPGKYHNKLEKFNATLSIAEQKIKEAKNST